MGDRTNFQLQIAACPPEHARAVLQWIDELGLGEDWVNARPGPDVLKLGIDYCANDVPCGSTDETVGELADLPGVAFSCWEDPAYQWLGDLALHVPSFASGKKTWRNDCDADGRPYFTAEEVDKVLAMDGVARDWFLGRQHTATLGALEELNRHVVVIPEDDPDEYDPVEHGYVCRRCGTADAHEYLVIEPARDDKTSTADVTCSACRLAAEGDVGTAPEA